MKNIVKIMLPWVALLVAPLAYCYDIVVVNLTGRPSSDLVATAYWAAGEQISADFNNNDKDSLNYLKARLSVPGALCYALEVSSKNAPFFNWWFRDVCSSNNFQAGPSPQELRIIAGPL